MTANITHKDRIRKIKMACIKASIKSNMVLGWGGVEGFDFFVFLGSR